MIVMCSNHDRERFEEDKEQIAMFREHLARIMGNMMPRGGIQGSIESYCKHEKELKEELQEVIDMITLRGRL